MADDNSEEEPDSGFGNDELQEIEEAYNMFAVQTEEEDELEEEEQTVGPKGLLTTSNLPYAMKEVGFDPTEAEVFEMLDEVDPNNTGFVDFKTFVYLLKKHIKPLNDEQIRTAFSVFDRDGNGFISSHEIKYVTRNLGERYTDEEIDDMMREVDTDGDGKINYEDFSYFMSKH